MALTMMLVGAVNAVAYDAVKLTFNRTGNDASSVTVSVVDPATGNAIPGVSAGVTALSHTMKTSGTGISSAVLCPDVNATTSPTINLGLSVTGLPSSFKIASMAIDLHALNAAGGYQQNADNKTRRWNVTTTLNGSAFGSLSDIDIAAGVGSADAVHQEWDVAPASPVAATSPMTVNVAFTKGSENTGCFVGISSVTLSSTASSTGGDDPGVNPPSGETDSHSIAAGIYHIVWKAATSDYFTERAGGSLGIAPYSTSSACFWEIAPVKGKDEIYTIRNVATGRYIGSCNFTPSSASKITTSTTPVEYYIGKSASTSGQNANCYWLSSTDCANYATESESPRALNKDGASSDIITWTAGVSNVGSYWRFIPATASYSPFAISPSIGNPSVVYTIISPDGRAWDGSSWVTPSPTDPAQGFYLVGQGSAGGFIIVKASDNQPINGSAVYTTAPEDSRYYFAASDGSRLSLGGVTLFTLQPRRTPFALASRIYSMPCGSIGNSFITRATLTGCVTPLEYPLSTTSSRGVTAATSGKPSTSYTLFTRSRATLAAGSEATLEVTLNSALPDGSALLGYLDWDRDGVFETTLPLTVAGTSASASVKVPSDAPGGASRLRLRLTSNGLTGADDETAGQTLDLVVNVIDTTPAATLRVKSSDPSRGTATTDGTTATATALGTARFISWMEGNSPVSLDASFTPGLTRPMVLTAHFTPNLNDVFGGISAPDAADPTLTIAVEERTIIAPGARAIALFTATGALAARASGSTLDASALAPGIYIAVAASSSGLSSSVKIILK